jgi:hypothetical protein
LRAFSELPAPILNITRVARRANLGIAMRNAAGVDATDAAGVAALVAARLV